jgi:hypothetical protein
VRAWILTALILTAACGGSSPSSPTPRPQPAQPPPPARWVLSGTVRETLTGAPVADASLDFWQMETVTTDASGRWTLSRTGTAASPIYTEVKAPGYIDRRVYVTWQSGGRGDIAIDMIRDSAPFSLTFFRQIVRNDFDSPGQYQHMRRWTTAPNFYLNTFNPRTGHHLLQRQVDLIASTIRHVVPQITSGQFGAGLIEVGSGERAPQQDFINIEITHEPTEKYCGRAQVGANPGRIWFNYERCVNTCRGEEIGANIVAHEVGHAMGLWHHNQQGIMDPFVQPGACHIRDFSAAERHHSALLYARQPGNADPDWDQPSTLTATGPGSPPVVSCSMTERPVR